MRGLELLQTLDSIGYSIMRLLVSTLWQSTILIVAAAALSYLLRRRNPTVRFKLWIAAVLLIPLLPLITLGLTALGTPQKEIAVIPEYIAPVVKDVRIPEQFVRSSLNADPAMDSIINEPEASIEPLPQLPNRVRSYLIEDKPETQANPGKLRLALTSYPWSFLFITYCLGLLALLSWIAVGRFRIRGWIMTGDAVLDGNVIAVFQKAAEALGLNREYIIIESDHVPAPLTCRTFRPVVVMPTSFADDLTEKELLSVALHELSHVKRNDVAILTLLLFVRTALWFHPLVWFATRQISYLAELSCDSAVLQNTRESIVYADMLTRIAENLPKRAMTTELAAGFIFSKSAFAKRIHAILSMKMGKMRSLSRMALAGTVIAGVFSLAVALAFPLGMAPSTDFVNEKHIEAALISKVRHEESIQESVDTEVESLNSGAVQTAAVIASTTVSKSESEPGATAIELVKNSPLISSQKEPANDVLSAMFSGIQWMAEQDGDRVIVSFHGALKPLVHSEAPEAKEFISFLNRNIRNISIFWTTLDEETKLHKIMLKAITRSNNRWEIKWSVNSKLQILYIDSIRTIIPDSPNDIVNDLYENRTPADSIKTELMNSLKTADLDDVSKIRSYLTATANSLKPGSKVTKTDSLSSESGNGVSAIELVKNSPLTSAHLAPAGSVLSVVMQNIEWSSVQDGDSEIITFRGLPSSNLHNESPESIAFHDFLKQQYDNLTVYDKGKDTPKRIIRRIINAVTFTNATWVIKWRVDSSRQLPEIDSIRANLSEPLRTRLFFREDNSQEDSVRVNTTDIKLEITNTIEISGQVVSGVTNEFNRGIADATIYIFDTVQGWQREMTVTDKSGHFHFTLKADSLHTIIEQLTVVASRPDYSDGIETVEDMHNGDIATIALFEPATAKVTATYPDGRPIEDADIELFSLVQSIPERRYYENHNIQHYGSNIRNLHPPLSIDNNGAGQFVIKNLKKWSDYSILVTRKSQSEMKLLSAGEDKIIHVVMNPPGKIQGTIINGDTGKPLKNIEISARDVQEVTKTHQVRTDNQGQFFFDGIDPGEWRIMMKKMIPDHWAIPVDAVVKSGEVESVALKLEKFGWIKGHIIDRERGVPVWPGNQSGVLVVGPTVEDGAIARVKQDGSFRARVFPGVHKLTLRVDDTWSVVGDVDKEVTVRSGETVSDILFTISKYKRDLNMFSDLSSDDINRFFKPQLNKNKKYSLAINILNTYGITDAESDSINARFKSYITDIVKEVDAVSERCAIWNSENSIVPPDRIIVGSVTRDGDHWCVSARMIDSKTSEIVAYEQSSKVSTLHDVQNTIVWKVASLLFEKEYSLAFKFDMYDWYSDAKYKAAVLDLDTHSLSDQETQIVSEVVRNSIIRHIHSQEYVKSVRNENADMYRFVERDQIDKLFYYLKIDMTAKESAEFSSMFMADRIVTGTVDKVGNRYSLSLNLIEIATSETSTVTKKTRSFENLLAESIQEAVEELFPY